MVAAKLATMCWTPARSSGVRDISDGKTCALGVFVLPTETLSTTIRRRRSYVILLLDYEEFWPDSGTVHTHHCRMGVGNDALYITRNPDNSLVAYCHHCGDRGFYKNKLEAVLNRDKSWAESHKPTKNKWDIPHPDEWDSNERFETPPFDELPKAFRYWWLSSGLNVSDVKSFGIKHLDGKWATFPLRAAPRSAPTGLLARPLDERFPKWIAVGDKLQHPFTTSTNPANTLVVCEDFLSAMRCSKHSFALPLFGTTLADKHLEFVLDFPGDILIWLDNDNPEVKVKAKKIHARLRELKSLRIILADREPKHFVHEEELKEWIGTSYNR